MGFPKKSSRLYCSTVIVFTATVFLTPISAQDVRLTTDDAAIIRAAIDAVIRPEMARMEQREASTPILIFDRTIAICAADRSHPRDMGCIGQEGSFSDLAKLSTVFKNDLDDPARAEIRTSFLARNKSNVLIRPEAVGGVIVAAPADVFAKYDRKTGMGGFHATVSMPGTSSDGRAIVYVSHWCGIPCGHGWFVLLKKTPDGWQFVAKHMLWTS